MRSLVSKKFCVFLLGLAGVLFQSTTAFADGESGLPTETPSFHPHLVGDLRGMFLVRSDNNFFQHANAYYYPIDSVAGGVSLTAGVELLPRIALLASGHYVMNGADRDSAHLRLASGALLGLVRWSFLRYGDSDEHFLVDLAAAGGFGRYFLRESYIDPALSPQNFQKDDGSYGGQLGLEASATIYGFRAVVGYAYHYAPASIADRIGGTVEAGGHEISLGIGVRL